jgi:hypothetical protein
MDFEFTLVFDLDIKHLASASKDRTGLFMDKPDAVITPDTGRRILKWCNEGKTISQIAADIKTADSVEMLRMIILQYPEYRKELEPLAIHRKNQLSTIQNPVSHGIS